jgi:hypothetical protein
MDRPGFRVSEMRTGGSGERIGQFFKESSPHPQRSFFLLFLLLFDVTLLDFLHQVSAA